MVSQRPDISALGRKVNGDIVLHLNPSGLQTEANCPCTRLKAIKHGSIIALCLSFLLRFSSILKQFALCAA